MQGNLIASGDEDGKIKVWDMRQRRCVVTHDEHHDYTAQLLIHGNTLFCAGGDGCMSTWDLRKNRVIGISQNMDEDLLSIAILGDDQHVVCGSQSGALFVWSWDNWEAPILSLSRPVVVFSGARAGRRPWGTARRSGAHA